MLKKLTVSYDEDNGADVDDVEVEDDPDVDVQVLVSPGCSSSLPRIPAHSRSTTGPRRTSSLSRLVHEMSSLSRLVHDMSSLSR